MEPRTAQSGGYFLISIDFELFWGMFDKTTIAEYGERIAGERTAVPRMLSLFEKYGIHATWAAVGMLMARDKKELCALLPPEHLRPLYSDVRMSAYHYISTAPIGNSEETDLYHYGEDLLRQILETPHQEVANHTFSHFYCIDGKHNEPEVFEADLDAHARIAETYGVRTASIVFPRNQPSMQALRSCFKYGLRAYRGTESHFLYEPREDGEQSLFIRGLRFLDHYVNISGYHTYPLPTPMNSTLLNLPSSRFFRPWNRTLRFAESLKMRRIMQAMTHAAKHGEVFHLWWHPHNFGVDQTENFGNLLKVLDHYLTLKKKYGMESLTMAEATQRAATTT